MSDAVRESSEAKAFTPSAQFEWRARPSIEDMQASRALFQPAISDNATTYQNFLDFGEASTLYRTGPIMLAETPHKKPDYERGPDGRWHFENPRAHGDDLAGKLKEWLWNDAPNLPRDTVNGAWTVGENIQIHAFDALQRTMNVFENEKGHSPWRDVSFSGIEKAYEAFPELAKHGIPKAMIGGIILNEVLHSGDPRDPLDDLSVQMFGTARDWQGRENLTASVGPAQIQIQNIRRLVEKFPQLGEFKEDPIRAAVAPATAPMFVAAYLSEKIDQLTQYNQEHHTNIKVSPAYLAYTYNPDVFSLDGHYRAKTAFEKLQGPHKGVMAGWSPVLMPLNETITKNSTIVKNISHATKMVETEGRLRGKKPQ